MSIHHQEPVLLDIFLWCSAVIELNNPIITWHPKIIKIIFVNGINGIIGQTIAGLASLAACFLVYTGFTLSWRRLISPYLRRTN